MFDDPPSKQERLLKLLERGSVFVHLDPRREGVVVPPWLSRRPQLVLQLGLNFAIPIPDLEVDAWGVRCTLSFNRTPFHCSLPWSAVYALVAEDGEVTVWHTELPAELVPEPAPIRRAQPSPRGGSRSRPRISVVPPPPDETTATPAPSAEEVPAVASSDPSPTTSREVRANDSLSMRPPAPPASEDPKRPPRDRPPYLRLIK